ncbi:MAG TPA: VWA domain-containing protein [Terriglobales bacterium]|nr:VWA domain-containing protein [Terriglobales bacterium]
MRLRNDRLLALLGFFLVICLAAAVQRTSAQSNAAPPPSAGASSPQNGTPAQNPAPQSPPQTTNPPPTTTPSQTAAPQNGAPSPQNQAPPQSGTQQPGATQEQPAQDQNQAPNDNGIFVFKKEVDEVVLHATVIDTKNNRMVMDLNKDNFTVYEDNQLQKISSFRHEDIPVAMGIVIDNSGSMREKRDKVNKAALNLVRSSNPQDQVFVVNFNDEYYLDQPFTGNINLLRDALEKVEARGGTALYDAIVASADYEKKQARLQKKVLFVVTDGEDNASRETLEEAIRRLQQENGPTVYTIGLLGEERARRARRALETIAQRSGGIAFFPGTLDQVDEISSKIAHDIRSQYTIGYKPIKPRSVKGYRTIKVEAHAKGYKDLSVRTRTGYFPGQEQGQ